MNARPRLLVAYASSEGQTERVARFVTDQLAARGFDVTLADAVQTDPDAGAFDAVVACASIHMEKHQPAFVRWARAQAAVLAGLPTAFLSVSMSAARDTPEDRAHVQAYLEQFVRRTGWTPGELLAVAGALRYTQYGFFTKRVMRAIARRNGTEDTGYDGDPLDMTRDHEFTDWTALEAFAARFAERARAAVGARAAGRAEASAA